MLVRGMKRGMTIEYLKCRTDLNFEIDLGVNDAISTIVTKWDLILLGYWIVFIQDIYLFLNTHHMFLSCIVIYLIGANQSLLILLYSIVMYYDLYPIGLQDIRNI